MSPSGARAAVRRGDPSAETAGTSGSGTTPYALNAEWRRRSPSSHGAFVLFTVRTALPVSDLPATSFSFP